LRALSFTFPHLHGLKRKELLQEEIEIGYLLNNKPTNGFLPKVTKYQNLI
jgi:hypothetical protein